MKRILSAILLLFVLMPGVFAQQQHVLKSSFIAKADTVWVFTPSGYAQNPGIQFPLIYILHGWNGTYHQWNDITDCQKLADKFGFIIVCPDGLYDSWYINSPAIKQSQYADFFIQDLMPFITKTYRVDRQNVFITGLSMGGHGALYLFEQKPELFRSAGSLSGVVDLSSSRKEYRISDYLGLKNDVSDNKILKEYSVTGNIGKIVNSGKEIIFSCGTADPFYTINNEFRVICDENKINATYISGPGAHNYEYWKSNIVAHFEFFAGKIIPSN
jgi:putative tributyrin esterase